MHLELVAAKKYLELLCRASPCKQVEHGLRTVCKIIMHPSCTWRSAGAQLTCEKQLTAARGEL